MPEAATARVLALEVPEAHCSLRIARLYDPPASILTAAQDFAREAGVPATRCAIGPALYYRGQRRISPVRLLQKKRQSRLALRAPGPDTSRLDVFAVLTFVRTINRKGIIMTLGTVKFFNSSKGFGFISPEGGAKDVFVHATALEAAGMTSLSEGQKVSFDIQPDAKGSKAVNLQSA